MARVKYNNLGINKMLRTYVIIARTRKPRSFASSSGSSTKVNHNPVKIPPGSENTDEETVVSNTKSSNKAASKKPAPRARDAKGRFLAANNENSKVTKREQKKTPVSRRQDQRNIARAASVLSDLVPVHVLEGGNANANNNISQTNAVIEAKQDNQPYQVSAKQGSIKLTSTSAQKPIDQEKQARRERREAHYRGITDLERRRMMNNQILAEQAHAIAVIQGLRAHDLPLAAIDEEEARIMEDLRRHALQLLAIDSMEFLRRNTEIEQKATIARQQRDIARLIAEREAEFAEREEQIKMEDVQDWLNLDK